MRTAVLAAALASGTLAVLGLASAPAAFGQKLVTPGYQFNSCPTCREIDGRFYLFTSHDPVTVQFEKPNPDWQGDFDYHAYSTTDFDHWIDHGSILNTHDAGWHKGNAVWDGDAGIPANGKYYAYIPFRMESDNDASHAPDGRFEIGVFVADRIEGPYADALGHPLTAADGGEMFGLSPAVVYDEKREPYLIWGSGAGWRHQAFLAKLRPNMIELAEPARALAVEEHNRCGGVEYFESPILFRRGNLWYFSYAAFNRRDGKKNCNYSKDDPSGCYIQYTTSKSMLGPFNQNLRHFIFPASGGVLNNQQGICEYKGNWYVAYHTTYEGIHQQVCVTRLNFNPDGSLVPIHPDDDPGAGTPGISVLTLDAYANKREAEEFNARMNADGERGILGDYHLKMKNGGYLRFNRMEFGSGAAGFRVEVSSENPNLSDATLEFRLDSPRGPVAGAARVAYTKGAIHYVVLTGPVRAAVGEHDICLVAHGSGGDREGHLFNVNWFTFTRAYHPEPTPLIGVDCGGPGEDGLSPDQAYAEGGWGYAGPTTTIATQAAIYYNRNLPNALMTARIATEAHGSFSYKFTVPPGRYALRLIFAETVETELNARTFDVAINGRTVLAGFDILRAAAGPNRAAVTEFDGIDPRGGVIDVGFISGAEPAEISAIKVYRDDGDLGGASRRIPPVFQDR